MRPDKGDKKWWSTSTVSDGNTTIHKFDNHSYILALENYISHLENNTMIKSKKEYEIKLKRFESIFHAEVGTPEGDEAKRLAKEIGEYEDKFYPIPNE